MKIGSYNIRGLGGRLKREAIRNLVNKERLDFLCIQKTKMETCDRFFCQYLWGSSEVDWVFRPLVGNSGGMLCLWYKDAFVLQDSFDGVGFLGVKGIWRNTTSYCYIFNVYSPCTLAGKRGLWEELKAIRGSNLNAPWCVAGDFNVVRSANERRGSSLQLGYSDMVEFDKFIYDMGLNDLPLIGRKYTWRRANGACMSRIDRFLISDEWLNVWQDLSQWGMDRTVSDHCAIVLKPGYKDWGPKPFHVLNCWLQSNGFAIFFAEKWGDLNVSSWGSYVVKEKLKLMKQEPKAWKKNSFGDINVRLKLVVADIKQLDEKAELGSFMDIDNLRRREAFESFRKLSFMKDSLTFQKSRIKMAAAGRLEFKLLSCMCEQNEEEKCDSWTEHTRNLGRGPEFGEAGHL